MDTRGLFLADDRFPYSGFGQAIETYRSHAGTVALSTTPSVPVAYVVGSANTIRPIGITAIP